jgi:hypothetical protein
MDKMRGENMGQKKTYLIKVWFFHDDIEPPEVIRGKMLERFKFLGDSLENIEVIDLEKEEESKK